MPLQRVNYISRNGSKLDIRSHVGRSLKGYTVAQGACSDGKYIYVVFERQSKSKCKIVKLEVKTLKVVKVSNPLSIGHGNDIEYYNGNLYATYSKGKKIISVIDANTLYKTSEQRVSTTSSLKGCTNKQRKKIKYFNGICRCGNTFLLRVMGGRGMLNTNNNMRGLRFYKTNQSYETSQSMTCDGRYIIRAYSSLQTSNKNFIVRFDLKGKQIKKTLLKVTGELESVFFVGKTLYGLIYRKQKKNNKILRKAFLFRIPKY